MAKILLVLIAVLFVGYHYSSALPTVSPSLSTTKLPDNLLEPKCQSALNDVIDSCNHTTEATWKKSNLYQQMLEAKKKGDKVEHEKLMTHLDCCEYWSMFDCGLKLSKKFVEQEKCSKIDYTKVLGQVQVVKSFLESQKCKDYHYVDRAQECKP